MIFLEKISLFPTLTNPVSVETYIDDYFNLIRGEDQNHIDTVLKVRQYNKQTQRSLYDSAKKRVMTATLQAVILEGERRNTLNIKSTNGIVYFDIDDDKIVEFNKLQLDKSKIFFMHKSVGGNGVVICVKTKGVKVDSLVNSKAYIAKELGIEGLYDKFAGGWIRTTVVSYDPNIFINPKPKIFNCNEVESDTCDLVDTKGRVSKKYFPIEFLFSERRHFGRTLKSTADLYCTEYQEGVPFPEGIKIVEEIIRPHHSVKVGFRKRTLRAMLLNKIYLNRIRETDLDCLFQIALDLSKKICVYNNPLPIDEIQELVDSILDNIYNDEPLFASAVVRKTIFHSRCGLSKSEKISISHRKDNQLEEYLLTNNSKQFTIDQLATELNISTIRVKQLKSKLPTELQNLIIRKESKQYSNSQYNIVLDCINNWDTNTKLSVTKIAKQLNINIETVKKHYYKILKEKHV